MPKAYLVVEHIVADAAKFEAAIAEGLHAKNPDNL
jgi:hypothetical protein